MSPNQCRQAHAEMCGDLANLRVTNRAVTFYRGQVISTFADFSTPRRSSQMCRPGSYSGTHPRPSHNSRPLFRSARVESREMTANFIGRKHMSRFGDKRGSSWRKPDAQWRRWRNSSVFLRAHSQSHARRRNAGSRSFGSGPRWTMSLFGNRGLGPHSKIAGLLLFPPRPSRGNCLSAATGFRFQWRRNRFACRNVLLWRLPG